MERRAPRVSSRSALLRPVGPRDARVYWTRRLVLLLVVVIVVALLAHACSGGSGTPDADSTPQASATPSSSASPSPAAVSDCRPHDLKVTASTDAATYPTGDLPRLAAVVRNVSDQPCRFRTEPARRIWTVVSGADQVWTSADCTVSGGLAKTRLRPGKTIVYGLVWNRHRSAEGCPSDTPAAERGTYQLDVTVNGVAAPRVVFHLTG